METETVHRRPWVRLRCDRRRRAAARATSNLGAPIQVLPVATTRIPAVFQPTRRRLLRPVPSLLAIAIATLPPGAAHGQVEGETRKPVDAPARAAAIPAESVVSVMDGWVITLPAGWTSESAEGSIKVTPSLSDAPTAPMLIGIGVEAWDPSVKLDDIAAMRELQKELASLFTGFKVIGDPAVVRGWLDMRLEGGGEDGRALAVRLMMRPIGDKAVTLAVVGSPKSVADGSRRWEAMIDSVRKGTAGVEAVATAKDNMKTTSNPTGGFAVSHEPSWEVRSEGPATVIMPTSNPSDPSNPELYGFNSAPWTRGGSLEDAANAETAANMMLADMQGLRREGKIEKLDGGGIMLSCSGEHEGRTMRIRLFARLIDGNLVSMLVLGDDATIDSRLRTGRTLFATLRKSEVAKGTAAAGVDPAFVGRWSCEEALTSGGGFDVGGAASLVTERILELDGDGTFVTGSRAATGNSDTSVVSGFTVDARGTWRIERGAETTYLLLTTSGGADRLRCTIHEGQLVVGEPGSRKFFTRLD